MANHNKDSDLVEEKQALSLFFNSLLTDTENNETVVPKITTSSDSSEYKTDADVKIDSTVFLPVISIEISEQRNIKSEENNSEAKTLSIKAESRDVDDVFQIMMFKTAGLTLAVPLVELSGVISWPENITEMPGHKDSYLGLVQHLGKKVPVIDIAQIVFPQDRLDSLLGPKKLERLQRIVFINDFEWGLACDAVNDVITIDSKQIKWRKTGTKRAWLAGTVVEHMCALLDTNELSKLLNSDHS